MRQSQMLGKSKAGKKWNAVASFKVSTVVGLSSLSASSTGALQETYEYRIHLDWFDKYGICRKTLVKRTSCGRWSLYVGNSSENNGEKRITSSFDWREGTGTCMFVRFQMIAVVKWARHEAYL